MKIIALVGVIVIAILGVGYFTTSNEPAGSQNVVTETESTGTPTATGDRPTTPSPISTAPDEAPDSVEPVVTETEEAQEDIPAITTTVDAPVPGSYETYSASALAASDADTKVLFFHASWCPSCRALESNIIANQADIPEGVAIFKANYDTETQLKRDFGVVRQHSIVVLNSNGVQQGGVTHPATLSQLIANL